MQAFEQGRAATSLSFQGPVSTCLFYKLFALADGETLKTSFHGVVYNVWHHRRSGWQPPAQFCRLSTFAFLVGDGDGVVPSVSIEQHASVWRRRSTELERSCLAVGPLSILHRVSIPALGFEDRVVRVVCPTPIGRHVLVAESFQSTRIDAALLLAFHLEEQLGLPCACDVKCLVAILVSTLDASAHLLLTNVAVQLPSALRHLVNVRYGLHERHVSNRNFWNPNRAEQVRPSERICLLECAVHIGTENTSRCTSTDFFAFAAKPLTFRDEGYTIAFLMHGQVATITEYDGIGVLTVSVIADRAFTIWLVSWRIGIAVDCRLRARTRPMQLSVPRLRLRYPLLQSVVLLFDLCHRDFKDRRFDGVDSFALALLIYHVQPFLVLLVHIVFNFAHHRRRHLALYRTVAFESQTHLGLIVGLLRF